MATALKPPQPPEPAWLQIARRETGVAEVPGAGINPRIAEYLASTTHPSRDDATAWCSAFVNWVFLRAGIQGTRGANARSWLGWGTRLLAPKHGCVVVFKADDRGPKAGHVGFYVGQNATHINVFGGNQGNKVSEKLYAKRDLLGYFWPKQADLIKIAQSVVPLLLLGAGALFYMIMRKG